MDILIQQTVNGLVLGSIYVLITLGYTMVYGILGIINFAHGDVPTVGAMSALTTINLLQKYFPDLPDWLALVFMLLLAAPVCTIVAHTIERAAYRPLRDAPRLASLITAIGMLIVLQTLAMMIWPCNPLTLPQPLSLNPTDVGSTGAIITGKEIVIILVSTLVMAGLILLVNRTKLDRVMRVTAENQCVAGPIGVSPDLVISTTFMIGAAMATVADVMMVTNYGSAHFYIGFIPGLRAFTAMVLGGIGSLAGATIGDMLLGLTEALGAGHISDLTDGVFGLNYQNMFTLIVLIGVLLFRPSGITGERVADRAQEGERHDRKPQSADESARHAVQLPDPCDPRAVHRGSRR